MFAEAKGALRIVRTADGEQLFQILPTSPSQHGISLTASGLYEVRAGAPLPK